MRPADDIKRLIDRSQVESSPQVDRRILADALEDLEKRRAKRPMYHISAWRRITRSSVAKMAVAAAVVLVAAGGTFLWIGTKPGIALADVLAKMEQVQAFTYKMTMQQRSSIQGEVVHDTTTEVSMLISNGYGIRVDMRSADPNDGQGMRQQIYILPQEKMIVVLDPSTNTYTRTPFDEATFEEKQREHSDPRLMLKRILACRYADLGKTVLDSTEVQGFQTTDPAYLDGFDDFEVTVWVSLKTALPMRLEMKANKKGEEMLHHFQYVLYDFQWDTPVSVAEFTPVIPVPAIAEETAIAGLKLCVDFSNKYPHDLNRETLTRIAKDGFRLKVDEMLKAQKYGQPLDLEAWDEQLKKAMDTMTPIETLGTSYMNLVREEKEPAYYGKIVAPGDMAQVLLRWKTGENEYRVVFGDLHAETVDADTLAKLETALPK